LSLIDNTQDGASLRSVVRIEATRYHKARDPADRSSSVGWKATGKLERETRYCISSLAADATRMNAAIRQHRGIENKLHWVLDMDFGEETSRKRAGYAAQNFSLLNRIALNLIRKDISKGSIRGKRLQAAWDDAFLWHLLMKNNS
jgi:predicted transposase YbfD/YdcC